MFTITRNLARQLKTMLRLALRLTPKAAKPMLLFTGGSRGVSIRCQNPYAAVEYTLAGRCDKTELVLPYDVLGDVANTNDSPVCLRQDGNQFVAEFVHRGETILKEYLGGTTADLPAWPSTPRKRSGHDSRLLTALAAASQVTDEHSSRYALGNLLMQGSRGRIVATDGRQVCVEDGFEFPWKDDLLVLGSKVFQCKEWHDIESVEVGVAKTHFFLLAGPWKLWLPLTTEGRFPQVDDAIPKPDQITTTITVTDEDAAYVLAEADKLPIDDDHSQAVTVEAGIQVVFRSWADAKSSPVELVLTNSSVTGKGTVFNTDRRYLLHALRQGFRALGDCDGSRPIVCRDGHRLYAWALLEGNNKVKSAEGATRFDSPASKLPDIPPTPSTNGRTPLPRKKTTAATNGHVNNGAASSPHPVGIDLLIEQAETIRNSLRDTNKDLTDLIAGLKAQRKQTKQFRSTLASLKQLQVMDA